MYRGPNITDLTRFSPGSSTRNTNKTEPFFLPSRQREPFFQATLVDDIFTDDHHANFSHHDDNCRREQDANIKLMNEISILKKRISELEKDNHSESRGGSCSAQWCRHNHRDTMGPEYKGDDIDSKNKNAMYFAILVMVVIFMLLVLKILLNRN